MAKPKEIKWLFGICLLAITLLIFGYRLNIQGYEEQYETAHQHCKPVSFSKNEHLPPTDNRQSQCDYEKDKEKAIIDRRLADSTDSLAIYTELLFVATLFLAIGTVFLVCLAYIQRGDTTVALKEASRSADASARQAAVAEMGFRPYIFVVIGRIIRPHKLTGEISRFIIECSLINKGNSPAIIEHYFCEFLPLTEGGIKTFSSRIARPKVPAILGAGETGVPFDRPLSLELQEIEQIIRGEKSLWFWGSIKYHEINGATHATGFRLHYDIASGTLTPIGENGNYYT